MLKSFFGVNEFFLVVTAYFADFVELLCWVIPQNYTKSENYDRLIKLAQTIDDSAETTNLKMEKRETLARLTALL